MMERFSLFRGALNADFEKKSGADATLFKGSCAMSSLIGQIIRLLFLLECQSLNLPM